KSSCRNSNRRADSRRARRGRGSDGPTGLTGWCVPLDQRNLRRRGVGSTIPGFVEIRNRSSRKKPKNLGERLGVCALPDFGEGFRPAAALILLYQRKYLTGHLVNVGVGMGPRVDQRDRIEGTHSRVHIPELEQRRVPGYQQPERELHGRDVL